MADRRSGTLILGSGRQAASRRMAAGNEGPSWFARRCAASSGDARSALLTMRSDSYFPYVSRIFAWILAMPEIQRS